MFLADQGSPVQAAEADRYGAFSRYIAPYQPQFDWKRCTPAECDYVRTVLHRDLMLNWETSTGMMRAGAAVGTEDAKQAQAQAHERNYPHRIYFSDDEKEPNWNVVAPYVEGVASVLGPQGFYGGEDVGLALMDRGLVDALWVTNAAYFSSAPDWPTLRAHLDPRVAIVQHLDHPFGFAGLIDHNEVLRADYLGGPEVLDPNDPIVQELRAAAAGQQWFLAVIKGDPAANKTLNFLTDIHNAEGAELDLLRKLVAAVQQLGTAANPGTPTDVNALANALAPLLAPAERKAVADVLATAHA